MKYYIYANHLDRGKFPVLKIDTFDKMMKKSFGADYNESEYCQKNIQKINSASCDEYIEVDDFLYVGNFEVVENMKYIVIGLAHPKMDKNIVHTNDPQKYIYETFLKSDSDYDSDHESEPNDMTNKIINVIDSKDDIIIDINYRYHCLKKGSYDFDSCVRLINMNKKIKSNSIGDLKNHDGPEDYFTPIYVWKIEK